MRNICQLADINSYDDDVRMHEMEMGLRYWPNNMDLSKRIKLTHPKCDKTLYAEVEIAKKVIS